MGAVHSLARASHSNHLAAHTSSRWITVFDAQTGALCTFNGEVAPAIGFAWSADGTRRFTALDVLGESTMGRAQVWGLPKGQWTVVRGQYLSPGCHSING